MRLNALRFAFWLGRLPWALLALIFKKTLGAMLAFECFARSHALCTGYPQPLMGIRSSDVFLQAGS